MDVITLGTGTPMPHPQRAGPSALVKAGAANILVDCGRAVVMRLAGAGAPPQALSAVLITHMHSDHISDLNDIVTTHWIMNPSPRPLRIYGPTGLRTVVDAMMAMLGPDIAYRIAHHDDLDASPDLDVVELTPGDRFEIDGCAVVACETDHAPATPSLGYRIEHEGAIAAMAGDTIPCRGLDELCRNADVYVQAIVRDDIVRRIPSKRLNDILDYHCTPEQAARVAARAGVKTLMATHFVPPLVAGREEEWRALIRPHFDGEIILADDLTKKTITRR